MTPPAATHLNPSRIARHAFSLIELLVVITIIAVVIAITVPALSGARDLARKSSTESSINSLVQGIGQFQADNQRAPGYFSPEDMGSPDNIDRGFSAMQNIMLELVGGPVEANGLTATNLLRVGPIRNEQVFVDPALIGIGDKAKGYYTPDAKDYQPAQGVEATADHQKLPEVLDAWGMPILAWVENDLGSTMNDNSNIADFAQIKAGDASDPARFYWAQNAGALSSQKLGQRQIDQAGDSLLGTEVTEMERVEHMAAFLGSPNSSVKTDATVRSILPRVGRGNVVFQSAGSDRVYLSDEDKGYGRIGGDFWFGRNLTPGNNVNSGQYDRKDGTKGSIDIVDGFDDIVTSAGN
ncbi:MAG: prepilin-type N-terminal cleavage/methylation domain-containing protein [Phycisphaerales bacterium]|nr:prepilin-type N-terminal cleavage/methylation domain-containing protein [Phycisphaerales bacterium]MCB9837299.1 prepilin-type N-terminal cleavage/methylation domain-containing protein [Phycisphaera sp.]